MCDHLYETTSRYEAATKVLTFLLVCPICCFEEVVETLAYEPNFAPRVTGVPTAAEGNVCDDDRAAARRALDPELAVEGTEPVGGEAIRRRSRPVAPPPTAS